MENNEFFSERNNKNVLEKCLSVISRMQLGNSIEDYIVGLLQRMLDSMRAGPQRFDKNCPKNIELIGVVFINILNKIADSSGADSDFRNAFEMAYRFVCELGLRENINIGDPLYRVQNDVVLRFNDFDDQTKVQINYANTKMPYEILKDLLNDENMKYLKIFYEEKTRFDEIRVNSNNEIDDRISKVNDLKLKLDDYRYAFNFVGLYDGFLRMSDKKKVELDFSFIGMIVIGCCMLGILAWDLSYIHTSQSDSKFNLTLFLLSSAPLVTIEILLLYFFRVVLSNFNLIKTQILQIDLRMSLCQFIQSYVDYTKGMKSEKYNPLEKFENLIFSGIVSDKQDLPSTFDGLEQMSKIISSIQGK